MERHMIGATTVQLAAKWLLTKLPITLTRFFKQHFRLIAKNNKLAVLSALTLAIEAMSPVVTKGSIGSSDKYLLA